MAQDTHPSSPLRHEHHERRKRILNQGASSTTQDISDAVVIKDGNIFFLAEQNGNVPLGDGHGLGLYYHDCRYLDGYELRITGLEPVVLVATALHGFKAIVQLTNPDIPQGNGGLLHKESIGVKWERIVDGATQSLYDAIAFENFTLGAIELPVSFAFSASFEDVFVVRGIHAANVGGLVQPPAWEGDRLRFVYKGADGIYRSVTVHVAPMPRSTEDTTAHFRVALQPRGTARILVTLVVTESSQRNAVKPSSFHRPNVDRLKEQLRQSQQRWHSGATSVVTDNLALNQTLERSLDDLRLLRSHIAEHHYIAAGVPWYVTLFGRDSIIASLQMLMFDPRIAEETLRVLVHYQGKERDDARDEEPGKILHELRVGELARTGEIPYTPYYGTVDATPLFLVLLGRHAQWTGDLALFDQLRGHVEAALKWIAHQGDSNGDGYLNYAGKTQHGLANQGWKDSGDAIVNADGSLATPPIALVEVQGYVYLAKRLMAQLYRRDGNGNIADRLEREAMELRDRFNRDFWIADKGIYALALQAEQRPATVVASNAGHALWSGIADADKARKTMERLMADDMFSGWGVRTLASTERRYNPVSYHVGSVWPHDNGIIAAGFRRYGFDDAAHRIFAAILEAALNFNHYRLPELFSGFARDEYEVPVRYPVACHPQAWGAGTLPYLTETLLGLQPNAFERRLRIVRPDLPEGVDRLTAKGLRVGSARVDLQFDRGRAGVSVRVLKTEGTLDVPVEL